MFLRPFHPARFLLSVYGTDPFLAYCRERGISFAQRPHGSLHPSDLRRWKAALADLPHALHAQVELELATVNEMADDGAIAHLQQAGRFSHPPPAEVPSGAPLALWYLVHQPSLFRAVFFHHEIEGTDAWRVAQARPGLSLADVARNTDTLAKELKSFFQQHDGNGRFCTVDVTLLQDSCCFTAQVADRLQFVDTFTDDGAPIRHRLRRAHTVLFVYHPSDGLVLLRSRPRSQECTVALLDLFGRSVLGGEVRCRAPAFDLEPLKWPFHPLPDGEDMELVRVRALHLRYPARDGRRQLKLETLPSDAPSAIDHLLATHVGPDVRTQLQVAHAELQVRLLTPGGSRSYAIRLWPHCCNLSQTPLGNRFRTCLKRWGLAYAK